MSKKITNNMHNYNSNNLLESQNYCSERDKRNIDRLSTMHSNERKINMNEFGNFDMHELGNYREVSGIYEECSEFENHKTMDDISSFDYNNANYITGDNSQIINRDLFDVHQIRQDFPILSRLINGKPLIWLDNGATSQKPKVVIDAISNYYSQYNSNVHRGVHTLSQEASELFDKARREVASFINGSEKEIIFVKGATEGLNLLANTIGMQKVNAGDDILITQLEHHSNILPWRKLAQEKNANLKIIPIDSNGDIVMDVYSNMLSEKTKIVSLAHIANSLGTLVPVESMIQQAKMHGAITILDGAQSIPHIKIDVQELGCDFFVFSGHKMFAPTGTGVVFGREDLLKNSIPYQVGGGMIHDVKYEQVKYAESPYVYEAGTANLADIEGLRAAIGYLNKLDMNNVENHEHDIVQYAYEQMKNLDHVKIIGNPVNRVGVLSFIVNGIDNNEVGKKLDEEGIAVRTGHHCAQPSIRSFGIEGTVRASFAFYNTHDEVDKFIDVLRKIR
ncbi:cysteine desulfurase [Candidatus Cytomitobacter indipagum]|uniref:Cysteine desulfurase n=1 Tax=Candidatus Cytomitobacter indipagum TaxID=2601575 RepID=A0A5C0UEN5_9PROT|nr:cysteine desulfurase [Candidatus Cytomitobacter indipagum]QEK38160.1 cysteine desulfurase [Candidatus Cytomitobacter indipagum]